jgi:type II pantothenate kinase
VEEEVWQQLNAYVAGVLSVCAVLLCKTLWQALQLVPDSLKGNGEDEDDDNLTWIDPWNAPIEAANRLLNNIGELPLPFKKRQHWPWETIRQRFTEPKTAESDALEESKHENEKSKQNVHDSFLSPEKRSDSLSKGSSREGSDVFIDACNSNHDDDDDSLTVGSTDLVANNNEPTTHESLAMKKNKSLCIGSILGLDVGGTLAKLVYFEQKKPDYEPNLQHRHYSAAASANAFAAMTKKEQGLSKLTQSERVKRFKMNANSLSSTVSENDMTSSIRAPLLAHTRRRSFSTALISNPNSEEKETAEGDHDQQRRASEHSFQQQDLHPDNVRPLRHSVDFSMMEESDYHDIYKAGEDDSITSSEVNRYLGASTSSMGRSKSMFDMSSHLQQKAEALDRFYTFARRLGDEEESIRDHKLSFYSRELGGEFHFIRFETRRMRNAMDLIRFNNLHLNIHEMGATGGGAHKFAEIWERELGIQMDKQDELDSLVAGMQFVLSTVIGECYTFRPARNASERSSSLHGDDLQIGLKLKDSLEGDLQEHEADEDNDADSQDTNTTNKMKMDEWWWSRKVQRDSISYSSSYPYLLVTIGTGVSVLRVDGPRKYERISGSTIGGGTYWGLMRLLTDVESFDDAMKLAEVGDPSKVDMMVGDIYGTNSDALEKLGLPANVVASSFGKLVAKEEPAEGLTQEDLARALLLLVTNNIGQVSYLNAKLCNTRRIYFVGSFLRQNTISQQRLSYAIDFWSKGEMEALFLEHEGYFGALGAFLKSQKIEKREEGFFQWDGSPHGQAYRHRKW